MAEIKTEQSKIREENLFSVRMEESPVMSLYHKVPNDYRVDMLARQFLPAIREKMEITSEMNEDYGTVTIARAIIIHPSEVFKYWNMKPYEEIVVLDYRGFSKRTVVRQDVYHVEMALEPDIFLPNWSDVGDPSEKIEYERVRFVYDGQKNLVGERIFRYKPEIKKKRRNK
jgi:hypothetical protein